MGSFNWEDRDWKRLILENVSFPRAPLSLVVFPCVSTAITGVGFGSLSPEGNVDMPSVTGTANWQKGKVLNVQKRWYRVAETPHFQGE